jgi:hypothetical protein
MQGTEHLPRYRSHKIVRAAQIARFGQEPADSSSGIPVFVIVEDLEDLELPVPPGVFRRGRPAVGDYLVFYDDGYVSWSPKLAFEDGGQLVTGAAPP